MIKAVVFDAFGTLVEIRERRHPYKQLLKKVEEIGRKSRRENEIKMMTSNVSIWTIATSLGLSLSEAEKEALEVKIETEVQSVEIYEDVAPTLKVLRDRRINLGICSNLAQPYAQPVLALLPEFDAYVWSFEVGAAKPDPRIYQSVCQSLKLRASEILMVGDTIEADCAGPRRNGMSAIHLSRTDTSPEPNHIKSLAELIPHLDTLSFTRET